MIENKILAPKLYKENYKKNFIEIEDFGDDTVFKLLKKKEVIRLIYIKNLLIYFVKFKKLNKTKLKILMEKIIKIPVYDDNKLFKEAKLFSDWYAKKYISKKKLQTLNIEINKQIKFLLSNLKLKNDTLFIEIFTYQI